jgi:hypothetical protein
MRRRKRRMRRRRKSRRRRRNMFRRVTPKEINQEIHRVKKPHTLLLHMIPFFSSVISKIKTVYTDNNRLAEVQVHFFTFAIHMYTLSPFWAVFLGCFFGCFFGLSFGSFFGSSLGVCFWVMVVVVAVVAWWWEIYTRSSATFYLGVGYPHPIPFTPAYHIPTIFLHYYSTTTTPSEKN